MPKKETHTVKISIAGRDLCISTEEDSEYVRKLADALTARIYAFKRSTGASTLDCALLQALCLADETQKLGEKLEKSKKAAQKRQAAAHTAD